MAMNTARRNNNGAYFRLYPGTWGTSHDAIASYTMASLTPCASLSGPVTHLMTADEQDNCTLFQLPPEIRNSIYTYALCQKQLDQVTTTRMPVDNPFEVINLEDAPYLRPSNELLATCQRIHDEARGIFVTEQRKFWASNNFQIDLGDDWEDSTDDDQVKPLADINSLRHDYFNLMPRLVVSTTHGPYHYEHHLRQYSEFGWVLGSNLSDNNLGVNDSLNVLRVQAEFSSLNAVIKGTQSVLLNILAGSSCPVEKYLKSAVTYVNIAAGRREPCWMEENLLEETTKAVIETKERREDKWVLFRRVVVDAVVQRLCHIHGVSQRPSGAARRRKHSPFVRRCIGMSLKPGTTEPSMTF